MTGVDSLLPMLDRVWEGLLRASVEGGLFATAIWAVIRLLPRIPARTRAALWWIACARFVISLTGVAPLGVPLDLPAPIAATVPASTTAGQPHGAAASAPASEASARPAVTDRSTFRSWPTPLRGETAGVPSALLALRTAVSWPWRAWIAVAWLALVLAALGRIAIGLWRSVLVAQGATRVDPSVLPAMGRVAERFGLERDPDVRVSESVRSPQLIWAGHGVVLLPAAALDSWTARDVELALAHEVAHLRRHDLAWGLAAAIVARAFAFHPMARLAAREYALAREAACDAEVLARTDASPFDYGRLLLALGVTRRPALSLSSAAWSGRSLKRRLVMLEHQSPSGRFHSRWIVISAALLAGLVGLTGAAQDPQPARPVTQPVVAGVSSASPPVKVATLTPVLAGDDQTPPPLPPAPPRAPAPPAAPPPPPPPPPASGSMHDVADAWVYLSGDQSFQHGSRHDRRLAEGLRQGTEPMFWFARDGKEYVIRDTATLDRIEQLLGPERALEGGQRHLVESQATLAHKQAEIAAQQAELASRVAELGAQQAALGAEEAKLRARMLASPAEGGIDETHAKAFDARAREFEHKMQELETEMRAHDERMRAFEPEQAKLARQMEQQAREFEAQMERAGRELKDLLTKAIASGAAQAVR